MRPQIGGRHPLLFGGLCFFLLWIKTPVAGFCYTPSGALSNDLPCDPSADVSVCCESGFYCTSNKLCRTAKAEAAGDILYILGTCTDKTWNSEGCPNSCTGNRDGGDYVWYCGDGNFTCNGSSACNSIDSTMLALGAPTIIATAGASTAKTQSSSTSTPATTSVTTSYATTPTVNTPNTGSSSSTSTSSIIGSSSPSGTNPAATTPPPAPAPAEEKNKSVAIGAGVGVAVGVIALGAGAGLLLWMRRNKKKQTGNASDVHGGFQNLNKEEYHHPTAPYQLPGNRHVPPVEAPAFLSPTEVPAWNRPIELA